MSKGSKIFLGILSFLPIILAICIMVYAFSFVTDTIMHARAFEDDNDAAFYFIPRILSMMAFIIPLAILSIGLMIYYIIHAINNKQIRDGEKIIWVIVFLLAGSIGYPVYWITRVWNEPPPLT